MTLIRVNPESLQRYGAEAQAIFDEIHASLQSLVNHVVEVRYFGPNAVAFKSESGQLAAEFANQLHADLSAMADAVRTSTSNIAIALGGSAISIAIDGRAIVAPAPAVVDYVDVDTSALDALVPVITASFESLRSSLGDHLQRLEATDWEGNAKRSAVGAVTGFTAAARGRCDTAEQSLTGFVRRQLDCVVTADR